MKTCIWRISDTFIIPLNPDFGKEQASEGDGSKHAFKEGIILNE